VDNADNTSTSTSTDPATATDATTTPEKGYGSATKDVKKAPPAQIQRPPLIPNRSLIELLTPEECRSIIGFGKHMPIFDNKGDATIAGSVKTIPGGSIEPTI
jgi:hypothetical protein